LKAKGDALEQIGHHGMAIKALDVAGKEFQQLSDKENWARSRISWILACAWLGDIDEALKEAAHARDIFLQLNEPYWACAIDHNSAVIYEHIGRYQDAVAIYEKMRAIYPTMQEQEKHLILQRIALAEMNQAVNLAWLGRFDEAYHLQQQAQKHYEALNEVDLVVTTEINLADLD